MTSTMPGWWLAYGTYLTSQADLFLQSGERRLATLLWSITARLTRPRTDRCTSRFTEKKAHSALRLIGTSTRLWTKFQTTSCQTTLLKMNPNKIKKAGDNATAAASFAKRTQLLELNALQLHTDRETCSKAWTKRPTMLSIVL
jgi:hypothetical protein